MSIPYGRVHHTILAKLSIPILWCQLKFGGYLVVVGDSCKEGFGFFFGHTSTDDVVLFLIMNRCWCGPLILCWSFLIYGLHLS